MPYIKTLTTLAVCDFCPATFAHVAGTNAPLALEFFFAHHWDIIPTGVDEDLVTVVCPACSRILSTVTKSIDRGLQKAGV